MKALLVIDMPDCCNNCPCYDGMEDRSCCNVLNEDMRFASYGRLGNCPLRPLPNFKAVDLNDTRDVMMFCHGWNACIDTIEGETE